MANNQRVTIRRAGLDDAETISAITTQAFEQFAHRVFPPFRAHAQSVAHVRYEMLVQRFVYGLAEVGGQAAGHVRYRMRPGYMHVSRLAVLPDFRGHGTGRQLMAWVESEAYRRNARILRGEVRTVLKEVLRYYVDIGYRVIGYSSLQGVRRCLTLIEKRLPAEAPPVPAPSDQNSVGGTLDESTWVDEASISPKLLHPTLGKLVGPPAHRARRARR